MRKIILTSALALLAGCFSSDPVAPAQSSSSSQGGVSSQGLSSSSIATSLQRILFAPNYRPTPSDSVIALADEIIYFSVLPTETGGLDTTTLNLDTLDALRARTKALGKRLSVSVGGYALSDNFPLFAGDSAKRVAFAQALVQFAKGRGLDGVDMDWEYPDTTLGQDAWYRDLLIAIHDKGKPLGLALSVNEHRVTSHLKGLDPKYLDRLQIMSYDQGANVMNGYVAVGRNGKLSESLEHLEFWTVKQGFPASKVVLGLPFYALTLKGSGGPLYSKAWNELDVVDPAADSVQYDGEWYYGNGPVSVAKKIQALKAGGYHGWMAWEYSQDASGPHSLLGAAIAAEGR